MWAGWGVPTAVLPNTGWQAEERGVSDVLLCEATYGCWGLVWDQGDLEL